jgi:hypothetical protein
VIDTPFCILPGSFWSSSSYGWSLPVDALNTHVVAPSLTMNRIWRRLSTSTSVSVVAAARARSVACVRKAAVV